ncbi:hypothetical protein SELMODRAFT_422610 [Selaginella moellendorffii]|uniref:Uncharacterized protein n=1 Tax=Selaginella moellendorffii TaxID=88036 RepID=D8SIZ7_SELML|nr:hypothetical protein SELMODRAFT_422610 [Selaginella moellendorffii]
MSNDDALVRLFANFHKSEFVEHTPGGMKRIGDEPVAGCFFVPTLGDTTYWDVPRSNLLYVRQDCVELFHELEDELRELHELRELQAEGRRGLGAPVPFWTLFIGQPGTGKTVIGLQLLFTFMKKGYTVVYHEKKMGTGYAVFKEKKFDSVGDRAEVDRYLMDQRTIFINDSEPITTFFLDPNTLFITSPDKTVYKEFTKITSGYKFFYRRLWSEEELKQCHAHVFLDELTWSNVRHHVYYVGYIPRLVFVKRWQFSSILHSLKDEISSQKNLLDMFTLVGRCTGKSHKIIHLDRGEESIKNCMVIGSTFIKEQLLLRLDVQHWRRMVISYREVGRVRGFRGEIMELLMHLTFPKFLTDCEQIVPWTQRARASNTVQNLVVDEEEDLHVCFYSDFTDLTAKVEEYTRERAKSAYFWPRLQTEAAIHSLYIDFKRKVAYLLHSTLAKKDLVVWHPVYMLVAGLYFVTSEANCARFDYHTWRKVNKTTGEHEDLLILPDLPQYKVKFQMLESDMEDMTPSPIMPHICPAQKFPRPSESSAFACRPSSQKWKLWGQRVLPCKD